MRPWSQPLLWPHPSGAVTTTWNPSDKSASVTLSGGNLTATSSGAVDQAVRATVGFTNGKHYAEFTNSGTWSGGTNIGIGITTATAPLGTVGNTKNAAFIAIAYNGDIWFNGVDTGSTLLQYTTTALIRIAIDLDNKRAWITNRLANWNGDSSGLANPATNVGGIDISAVFTGTVPAYPMLCSNVNGTVTTANFGGSAFSYPVPSGFTAWG